MPLTRKSIVVNVLLGLAYLVLGYFTLASGETGGVELRRVLWLPSGVAVAVGLLTRYPVWLGVGIGGALLTGLTTGFSVHALGTGVANGLEVGLSVALLHRVGFRAAMDQVRDVLLLIGIAAGLSAFLAALLSVASLALVGGVPPGAVGRILVMWWLTHASGIVIVVPLSLTVAHHWSYVGRYNRLEVVGVMAAVAVSSWMPFSAQPDSPLSQLFFVPLLFLLWAGLRLGMVGAAVGSLIVTGAAMTAAVSGRGALVTGTPTETLALTWIFSDVVMTATLIFAALVSDRERSRDAHQLEERRLRAVLNATDEGIIVTDENGMLTHVNRSVGSMWPTGSAMPVLGDSVERALSGLKKLLPGTSDDSPTLSVEIPSGDEHDSIQLSDGQVWEVYSDQLAEPDMEGGRIWSFRDVTARVRAAEQRERLEAQIRHGQKLESLGVMAGGIAHDFNNLLMAIRGQAELLGESSRLSSEDLTDVAGILKTSDRAAKLCSQMLAYAGQQALEVGEVDLSDCVREIQELLRVSVSREVRFEIDLAEDPLPVEGDTTQLRQVILNLVTNASEAVLAAADAGEVLVRTRRSVLDDQWLDDAIVHDSLPGGEYAVVRIQDDGVGMDQETVTRIFDPFFSSKGAGRGLGLAAALGVIRSHGGALRVDTRRSVGTVFEVALPLAPSPSAAAPGDACTDEPEPEGRWRTVLVVDDEDSVRETVSRMLERLDFNVVQAPDGDVALDVLARDEIDLVLLDLTMPTKSGMETLTEIRELGVLGPGGRGQWVFPRVRPRCPWCGRLPAEALSVRNAQTRPRRSTSQRTLLSWPAWPRLQSDLPTVTLP